MKDCSIGIQTRKLVQPSPRYYVLTCEQKLNINLRSCIIYVENGLEIVNEINKANSHTIKKIGRTNYLG